MGKCAGTRSLVCGLIVLAGIAQVVEPAAAQAPPDCLQWDVSGTWTTAQGNAYHPIFALEQSGETISGSATLPGDEADRAGYASNTGGVTGTMRGDVLDVVVSWVTKAGGELQGEYRGTIDGGSLNGSAGPPGNPTAVSWSGTGPATCLLQAVCIGAPQPADSPAFMPADFTLVVNANGGDPIIMPNPLPPDLKDVHLVTVDPTPDVVGRLRDKLAADLELNRRLLPDYQSAYKDAQKRLPELERLRTLLLNSLGSAGGVSVDARTAYQALYGKEAPIVRTLPQDRTMFLDPVRADQNQSVCGGFGNQSQMLTMADVERVSADIKATQNDIQAWPSLISQLQDQIQRGEQVLAQLDTWLLLNTE